jgi:hypothetical protein
MPSSRWANAPSRHERLLARSGKSLLSRACRTCQHCRGACLEPSPLALATFVPPPELDRNVLHIFIYRSASFFDALASIGSRSSYTSTLLAPANSTAFILVITALFVLGFLTRTGEEMEVEHSSYQGEPMLVDGLEEGLPFPHVVGKDGQHTVQHIDM